MKEKEKKKNQADFWGLLSQEFPRLYVKDISTVEFVWFIEDSTELLYAHINNTVT